MTIYEELYEIQQKLIVNKSQWNDFSKYNYRSCEDIMEAVKKVSKCPLIIQDELVFIGDRYYIKATASLVGGDGNRMVSATGFAREPLSKKGMDESQITGSCSSYARKYALNALFAIDDTKDADTLDNRHELAKSEEDIKAESQQLALAKKALEVCITMEELTNVWANLPKALQLKLASVKDTMKSKLSAMKEKAT